MVARLSPNHHRWCTSGLIISSYNAAAFCIAAGDIAGMSDAATLSSN
jgi:hypothetical protein